MNKQQLQQEIAELQKQLEEKQKALSSMPDKWEPKGGEYWVNAYGVVRHALTSRVTRNYGAEYATREQAEKAAKAMRAHNRLLAYVAEFAPDYKYNRNAANWFVFLNTETNKWKHSLDETAFNPSTVYMPVRVAEELCNKLNSGEVEL